MDPFNAFVAARGSADPGAPRAPSQAQVAAMAGGRPPRSGFDRDRFPRQPRVFGPEALAFAREGQTAFAKFVEWALRTGFRAGDPLGRPSERPMSPDQIRVIRARQDALAAPVLAGVPGAWHDAYVRSGTPIPPDLAAALDADRRAAAPPPYGTPFGR